jgi:hypothetical protein
VGQAKIILLQQATEVMCLWTKSLACKQNRGNISCQGAEWIKYLKAHLNKVLQVKRMK